MAATVSYYEIDRQMSTSFGKRQLPVLRVLAEAHNIPQAVHGGGKLCEVPDPGLASWGEAWSQTDAHCLAKLVPLEHVSESGAVERNSACMKMEVTRNVVRTVRKIIVWCDIQIKLNEYIEMTMAIQGPLMKRGKRRRRIDRSMIGEPTNFVHTAHVGSGDLFSGMNSVSSIQNQMQSKGGYGGGISANVQMQLVKPGASAIPPAQWAAGSANMCHHSSCPVQEAAEAAPDSPSLPILMGGSVEPREIGTSAVRPSALRALLPLGCAFRQRRRSLAPAVGADFCTDDEEFSIEILKM
ncbi:hypothetical protein IHE44_0011310, partial [Lamprotornis superbus]